MVSSLSGCGRKSTSTDFEPKAILFICLSRIIAGGQKTTIWSFSIISMR
ncbi:hypothetical protein [Neobacillus rhizosphaerae]